LIWPDLLYAAAQFSAGPKDTDHAHLRGIWLTAPDVDHLRVFATDGVAMLIATVQATFVGFDGVCRIDPAEHTKKPSITARSSLKLYSLAPAGDRLPFSTEGVKAMAGSPRADYALVDPVRMAKVSKALAELGNGVEVYALEQATVFKLVNPYFQADIRAVLANKGRV
jgi:hypothetical protein